MEHAKMAKWKMLVGVLFSTTSWAQSVQHLTFADKQFKQCVLETAESRGWTLAQQFTELKCHSMGIKRADEVVHFSQLTSLSLYNNELTQLELSPLTTLEEVNLASNRLENLTIAGLSNLSTLYLFRNNLKSVDLTGLSKLKTIRIMQNQLTSLDISPLISLEKGYLFDNKLEDLQIVGLEKLTFLDVRQNPMPDELYDYYDEQEGIVISHDGNADDWK